MVKLLVMCGSGIATSTIVTNKVKDWIKENNYDADVKVFQGKIAEELGRIDDYDIVISTTLVPDNIKERVISGINLITGMNTDVVYDRVRKEIEEHK